MPRPSPDRQARRRPAPTTTRSITVGMQVRDRMPAVRRRAAVIGVALAVAIPLIGVAADAAVPDGGVINGCHHIGKGALRVIDPAAGGCKANESPISWSQ